jgi:hypothetical protein
MDRAADLRADYEILGALLEVAEPAQAANLARERRIIGAELEKLEAPAGEVPLVDELAKKRSGSGSGRPPARRRKSG